METRGLEPPPAANQNSRPARQKRTASLPPLCAPPLQQRPSGCTLHPRPRLSDLSSLCLAAGEAEILAWEEILTGRAPHPWYHPLPHGTPPPTLTKRPSAFVRESRSRIRRDKEPAASAELTPLTARMSSPRVNSCGCLSSDFDRLRGSDEVLWNSGVEGESGLATG